MSSRSAVKLGNAPRFRVVPVAPSSAGREAADLAASVGLELDPWQVDVLESALGELPDGRWAAAEVGLAVARQNGKGAILEARELAGLFLFGEWIITHTAHRVDTCLEHFRRIKMLVEGSSELSRQVKPNGIRSANGQESIELRTGARLIFKARSKAAGRGFSGDLVVFDEAMWLTDLGSGVPSLSASPNPQIWYVGSAPLDREESDVWRRLVRQGRAGGGRSLRFKEDEAQLAYLEWSVDPTEFGVPARPDGKQPTPEDHPAEWAAMLDDRRAWHAANPGLGIRLSERFTSLERQRLTDDEFARERLGIFRDDDDAAAWEVISEPDWRACRPKLLEVGEAWIADPPSFGVDLTPDRRWGTIAAAGAHGDGVAVEVVEHGPGASWIVPRAVKLWGRSPRPRALVIDPSSPAGSLIPELRKQHVEVTEASTADHVKACGTLVDLVAQRLLVHRGEPELDAAVAGAMRRSVSDAWLWDRRKPTVVIPPLVAVTLAVWGHMQGGESVYEDRGLMTL